MIDLDARYVFRHACKAYDPLRDEWKKGLIQGELVNAKWARAVNALAGLPKKAVVGAAMAVSCAALGVFDLFLYPYHYYMAVKSIKADIALLNMDEQIALRREVVGYIAAKNLRIPPLKEEEYIQKALAMYARSQHYYGPVVLKWVDYLLKKSSQEGGKKLVFLARDGSTPYKLALRLLELQPGRYPRVRKEDLSLAYFSRKAVNSCCLPGTENPSPEGQKLIQEYLRQEGISEGDKCIFVDNGFYGDIVNKLKGLLPHNQIEFEYLISLNDKKARGFIATQEKKIVSVPKTAGNAAIFWLEDTHQGTVQSAARIVRHTDGRLYPNTLLPGQKQTYRDAPYDYLLRKWGKRSIAGKYKDGKVIVKGIADKLGPDEVNLDAAKREFDGLMGRLRRLELSLFIRHE